MTATSSGPAAGDEWDLALTPARQRERRDRVSAQTSARQEAQIATRDAATEELLDLERGRTAALIASLGRLQLSVEILRRDQQLAKEEIQQAVARIEERLDRLAASPEAGDSERGSR